MHICNICIYVMYAYMQIYAYFALIYASKECGRNYAILNNFKCLNIWKIQNLLWLMWKLMWH